MGSMESLPNIDLLKGLLENYMFEVDGAAAVAICDRDGFIIASESKEREGKDSDSVIGAISAFLDIYIDRIKNEYQTQSNFFNVTSMQDKKFVYCSMGSHSILTTIADPTTSDIMLKVYSEHIAAKVELILQGVDNVSIEIPEIIRVLSNRKEGKLPKGQFTAKLILTGDYNVGKTSLIRRFVENEFQEKYISTIGVEISKKSVLLDEDTNINFVIWDIGGQAESMTPYRHRFYEGASAAFIVIDRTRKGNLESVEKWDKDIKESIPRNIPIVIVANKTDLSENLAISEEEIKIMAKKYGFHHITTSARTGENVNEAFLYIAYRFIEKV
ncbi:MAG: GTP-binding protein [Candidatus Lokiarchaeota archaeon]|nr:GTP-binding protein [Candidatus Lokiarchaeota archaeon]